MKSPFISTRYTASVALSAMSLPPPTMAIALLKVVRTATIQAGLAPCPFVTACSAILRSWCLPRGDREPGRRAPGGAAPALGGPWRPWGRPSPGGGGGGGLARGGVSPRPVRGTGTADATAATETAAMIPARLRRRRLIR